MTHEQFEKAADYWKNKGMSICAYKWYDTAFADYHTTDKNPELCRAMSVECNISENVSLPPILIFDGAVANLMMQMYICNCDFRKRINKSGEEYGWDVAVYSSIEHIYGYDYVTSDYKEKPEASWQKIVSHMNILYSSATEKQIKKILK